MNLLAFKNLKFLFLFVSNRIFTNCHSRSNINCKSHHNKPAASGTNRNTAPTASVPSSNGSVPTTKWPRPDSTDHCTITKRCYYTGSDSHSTGSSRSRPTTGMSADNGTANFERSIPSFFFQSYTLISQPPVTSRTLAFLNRTFQYSEPKLTSLFQLNTFFPLLNSVFLIFR